MKKAKNLKIFLRSLWMFPKSRDDFSYVFFSPLLDFMFDVFKEVVAELITETINPKLGFNTDDRRKWSDWTCIRNL